jgi:phospholipid/cholesterol/gamma-HCH transport system substrate-binding protein
MARQTLPWAELKAGLLVLAALAILAVAIMAVGKKGGVFSENYELTTRFPRVLGLKPAAPVWLAGVEVGSVKSIRFVTETGESIPVIDVKLNIGKQYQHLIRSDSEASIDGKGLLGDKIVAISLGSNNAPVLPDGGRLLSQAPLDFSSMITEATATVRDIGDIARNLREVTQGIEEGKGSMGKFIKDQSLYDNLNQISANVAALTYRLGKTEGSLLKLLNDPKLYDEVTALVVDLRKGEGTIAKLIQDPGLYDEARGTLQNAQTVMKRVDNLVAETEKGQGNVGKLMNDEELYKSLNATVKELHELIADIKKNPGRYVKVSVF